LSSKGYVLVTRDKGFGMINQIAGRRTAGVIILRGHPSEQAQLHAVLLRLLQEQGHAPEDLLATIDPDA